MNREQLESKYAFDAVGAFGSIKNPIEKKNRRNNQYEENLNKTLAYGSDKLQKILDANDKVLKAIYELQALCRGVPLLQNAAKNLENQAKTFNKAREMAAKQSRADNRKYLRQKESGIH